MADINESGKVPVTFAWARGGVKVQVEGSWSDWKAINLEEDQGFFHVTVDLPEGTHQYRYVVDGKPTMDGKQPTAEVENVGKVNVLVIKAKPQ